ncbi:hypothetical protein EDB85DRAFT_2145189 [Lactarius pseudohatsudake]|nr:hypothetical protein EDB85DRAFT_2145189 [Lactarius pseudohatsudake]
MHTLFPRGLTVRFDPTCVVERRSLVAAPRRSFVIAFVRHRGRMTQILETPVPHATFPSPPHRRRCRTLHAQPFIPPNDSNLACADAIAVELGWHGGSTEQLSVGVVRNRKAQKISRSSLLWRRPPAADETVLKPSCQRPVNPRPRPSQCGCLYAVAQHRLASSCPINLSYSGFEVSVATASIRWANAYHDALYARCDGVPEDGHAFEPMPRRPLPASFRLKRGSLRHASVEPLEKHYTKPIQSD